MKKEIESKKKLLARKRDCLNNKLCSRNKLCTNLAFKILIDANDQSENKLEKVFLEEIIKNVSDSTWLLTNGKVIHPKGYKNIDKRYKEKDNLPYSFVILCLEPKTNNLKNLYEIIFVEKEGKIFQDSFTIINSNTGKAIISINSIKK